ncbi:hypothetical protein D3C85_1281370 [compost metagenome]
MTHFEQFIQHRALTFKFSTTGGMSLGQLERMVASGSLGHAVDGTFVPAQTLEEISPIKLQNVCAKLDQTLVDRLDNALSVLDMTKRDFIELAVIEALNKVDAILEETNAFEFVDARAEQESK